MCIVTFSFNKTTAPLKVKHFTEQQTPTWANLELTTECNLNCRWCYSNSNVRDGNKIDYDDCIDIINVLKKSGIKQITLSGGEPTIYPYLIDVVKYIADSGIIVNINSNCFNITEQLVYKLSLAGLNQVETNIESVNPETHDHIRGKNKSHANSVNALKLFKKYNITTVSQLVVTKDNQEDAIRTINYAIDLGVDRVRVWDVVGCEQLKPDDYYTFIDNLTSKMKKLGASHVQSYDPFWKTDILPCTHAPCPAKLGMLMFIKPDGDVVPCCAFDRNNVMYNILECSEHIKTHQAKLKTGRFC